MIEEWYDLTLEPGPRPALVIDASESAQKIAPYLYGVVEGVLAALADVSWPRIFFLGNPQPHDPGQFAADGQAWFRANAGRGSFITPVFETLEAQPEIAVAVAGSGPIFDLADWHGHPLAERAVWMRVGPVGLTGERYHEESYACEQLAALLNNPTLRVEIGGRGVMPVYWDDRAFHLDGMTLVGAKTTGSLRLGVLAPEQGQVSAAVVMANGVRRELKLEPAQEPPPPEWIKMPHGEYLHLRRWMNQGRFLCPLCQQDHPAGVLRCPAHKATPIFPTLEALPPGGFVLIDAGSWETRLQPHPWPVLKLSPESVAVRRENGAQILRFDSSRGEWRVGGSFVLFHPLEDRQYAMVL